MTQNNMELEQMLSNIKQILGEKSLLNELKIAIKHLPTYLKIVKTHIIQLQNVIASDNHKNKNLDDINLPPIVKQLIDIFNQLEQDDIEILEQLHFTASNNLIDDKVNSQTTMTNEVSEATL